MMHAGTIAAARYRDLYGLQLNGTDEVAYLDSPPWLSHSAGAWAFDATLLSFPGGTGNASSSVLMCGQYLTSGLLYIYFLRNTGFGDSSVHFGVLYSSTGVGGSNTSCGATAAVAVGTTDRFVVQSDGKIAINGVVQTATNWAGSLWTGAWYNTFAAGSYAQVLGGVKVPGSAPSPYGNVRLNNLHYISRPLTTAEIAEDYTARNKPWWSRSYSPAILHAWPFEKDLRAGKGGTVFIGIGLDGSNYVAP